MTFLANSNKKFYQWSPVHLTFELSKSSHLFKTDIFEDFFNNDKLRKLTFWLLFLIKYD